MTSLDYLRENIAATAVRPESELLTDLQAALGPSPEQRERIVAHGADLVTAVRSETKPSVMERFLADYGLSCDEGIALMCLAEALLRVPDAGTIDALIEDKIAGSDWAAHRGKSSSPLINASTWALMLTGKILDRSQDRTIGDTLRGAVKRVGEPAIRRAATQAMRVMGNQFVLGETIRSRNAARQIA